MTDVSVPAFTPGPWTTDYCDSVHQQYEIVSPKGYTVATVLPTSEKGTLSDARDNDKADAHLIASAPDLYEALVEYVSAFGQALEAHNIPFGAAQRHSDRKARAALRKARGE